MSFGVGACAPATAPIESEELTEDTEAVGEGLTGPVAVGSTLKTTGNVNLRTGASTSHSIIRVVPKGSTVTVAASNPSNGFYQVKHNGTLGHLHGNYLEPTGGSSGSLPTGTTLTATANVNLRSGPSTSYSVHTVVPAGAQVALLSPNPNNGFYNVQYSGYSGWSSSKYYTTSGGGGGGSGGSGGTAGSGGTSGSGGAGGGAGGGATDKITAAMQRAEWGVGFSYWWGHGRFLEGGPKGNAGSCSGSCPSCSHSGSYGGDCSGYVAKVWQVPSSNTNMSVDSHPYTTAEFNVSSSQWSVINRSNIKKADALNYRSNGAGHVFIYSHGDAWGSMYAYECKSCAAGCVKGYRTAGNAYKTIRRAGY
ncbi:MAG: SH3 domain-containing protein [Polyangiaceae bacterium]|nr:SH3 domain-containing protein [Polyangiaceae bacterium]